MAKRKKYQDRNYSDTCNDCGHSQTLTHAALGNAILPCLKCKSMNKTTEEIL